MTTLTSDPLLPTLDETRPTLVDPSSIGRGRLLLDHLRRVFIAFAGFRVYGTNWLRPWATYWVSPIIGRIAPDETAHFSGFNARLGECDLYTFANVFADYPIAELSRAIREVELILDLGANVGAFSFLMHSLGCKRIVALEPDADNVAFLRRQPFAHLLEIRQAAVGPIDGIAPLVAGDNSVTHHVDFSGTAEGPAVPVVSLKSLCDQSALVKMDIEGGELTILERGLPDNVRHLVLEWHHPGTPANLVPGKWRRISNDIHGASTWYFQR